METDQEKLRGLFRKFIGIVTSSEVSKEYCQMDATHFSRFMNGEKVGLSVLEKLNRGYRKLEKQHGEIQDNK